jgi:phosphodiesterase/alkaline phosphatase D-like protein
VASELVGRPTDSSITINLMTGQGLEAYVEYGTISGVYAGSTASASFSDGIVEVVLSGLSPDTSYYYRVRYRPIGSTATFLSRGEHTFHTQRPRTGTFTFVVQSDSHQGYPAFYSDQLYGVTINNIAGEKPDFLLDLGDAVSTDDATETQATVRQKYLNQRLSFDAAAHSMPVFLVLGNHENEEGWNLDDFGANRQNSLPVLGANARKRFFLNPAPGGTFYTGNTDTLAELDGDHYREDYYSFEWGNALFVVIDPYWYTMRKPFAGSMGGEHNDEVVGDRWDWTLGDQQYRWLKQTLTSSTAKFKFVFAHQMTGGNSDYGRAGAAGAKYCEWGGYDLDGVTRSFASHRPGWDKPIHRVLVDANVSAFFHGHDHVFAKESLDGIVYQEVPHAANPAYGTGFDTNPTDYPQSSLVANSGHLRVTVAPAKVTVDYVRSFLPGDGTNGQVAYSYAL